MQKIVISLFIVLFGTYDAYCQNDTIAIHTPSKIIRYSKLKEVKYDKIIDSLKFPDFFIYSHGPEEFIASRSGNVYECWSLRKLNIKLIADANDVNYKLFDFDTIQIDGKGYPELVLTIMGGERNADMTGNLYKHRETRMMIWNLNKNTCIFNLPTEYIVGTGWAPKLRENKPESRENQWYNNRFTYFFRFDVEIINNAIIIDNLEMEIKGNFSDNILSKIKVWPRVSDGKYVLTKGQFIKE